MSLSQQFRLSVTSKNVIRCYFQYIRPVVGMGLMLRYRVLKSAFLFRKSINEIVSVPAPFKYTDSPIDALVRQYTPSHADWACSQFVHFARNGV